MITRSENKHTTGRCIPSHMRHYCHHRPFIPFLITTQNFKGSLLTEFSVKHVGLCLQVRQWNWIQNLDNDETPLLRSLVSSSFLSVRKITLWDSILFYLRETKKNSFVCVGLILFHTGVSILFHTGVSVFETDEKIHWNLSGYRATFFPKSWQVYRLERSQRRKLLFKPNGGNVLTFPHAAVLPEIFRAVIFQKVAQKCLVSCGLQLLGQGLGMNSGICILNSRGRTMCQNHKRAWLLPNRSACESELKKLQLTAARLIKAIGKISNLQKGFSCMK